MDLQIVHCITETKLLSSLSEYISYPKKEFPFPSHVLMCMCTDTKYLVSLDTHSSHLAQNQIFSCIGANRI